MNAVLAFDIETIPDVDGIRRLHDLPADLPDREVAEIAFQIRRTKTGSDFLPPQLHRVVVISCVLRGDDGIRVFSLEGKEAEVIQRFYEGIEKFVPQLVSWNGGGFDLPVLNYRALIHGLTAPTFWETGDENRDEKHKHQQPVDQCDAPAHLFVLSTQSEKIAWVGNCCHTHCHRLSAARPP